MAKSYWQAVDKMIFGKSVRLLSTKIAKDRAG
jgi:hypothetical protein